MDHLKRGALYAIHKKGDDQMIFEVRMPRLDEDMTEGTVNLWIKRVGDSIKKGEPIVEIETEKVNYHIEALGSGILRLILAQEKEVVPINTIIGIIAGSDEDISTYKRTESKKADKNNQTVDVSSSETNGASTVVSGGKRQIISPVARKIATEKGLDISKINGSGPGGRITKEDVLNFVPKERELSALVGKRSVRQIVPLSGVRKTISDRLSASWHNSPRAENFMSVDVTELSNIRKKKKTVWAEKYGRCPSVNDMIIAAAAGSLRKHPMMNASLQKGNIEIYEDINISIAVALEEGLITPVVCKADTRDVFDIARETRRLAKLVREGEHSSQILTGSTFTITNLGMFDVDFFIPIINPPESAILAVGKIEKKPVVIQNGITIRAMMMLCLAYDHRVIDGVLAAVFLQSIKHALEAPLQLIPENL